MDETAYPHDHFVKSMLSRPDLAGAFLSHYLPPEIAARLDLAAPELLPESFMDEDLRVHEASRQQAAGSRQ